MLGCPEIGMLQCVPLVRYSDFDLPSTEYEKCIEKGKGRRTVKGLDVQDSDSESLKDPDQVLDGCKKRRVNIFPISYVA